MPRPASPTETVAQYVSVLSGALDAEIREIDTLTGSDGDFYEDEDGPFDEDDVTLSDNTTMDQGGATVTIFMRRY